MVLTKCKPTISPIGAPIVNPAAGTLLQEPINQSSDAFSLLIQASNRIQPYQDSDAHAKIKSEQHNTQQIDSERQLSPFLVCDENQNPHFKQVRLLINSAHSFQQEQILRLENYNQEPFDQMFNYLYTDRLDNLPANDGNRYARLEELRLLIRLANTFQLPDLQCQTVDHVRKHRLVGKIGIHTFFDWAYDIYTNEFDHTVGDVSKFFEEVVPSFLQRIDNDKNSIENFSKSFQDMAPGFLHK
ncbi:uncharacterized protein KY384_000154 [Bacidia gigantensis]|uniref:uncharacterized protein n=1 Tax=Bacidia gigantensis TaxID=2732470 RepID=UPI001D038ABC|nr:uncharacterized protein KY384_000154 [Bacidia gigantensis]KAG8526161.1 hypothetical protein KY384_000154 [Bacidia gigantensis]